MGEPLQFRVQVFDPKQDFSIVERRLPHWSQAGTIAFLTWRTWDSIPKEVLDEWVAQRDDWLRKHGIYVVDSLRESKASRGARGLQQPASRGARGLHWREQVQRLPPALRKVFQKLVSDRWNEQLDACYGECVLRQPALSKIVADSLLHFDGDRYELTDFVVMPNHVHVLAAFPDEESLLEQSDSWKHFTAAAINKALRRQGRFWQQDGFDHLVRSAEQYEQLRNYIADNADRANLRAGEFIHFSKKL